MTETEQPTVGAEKRPRRRSRKHSGTGVEIVPETVAGPNGTRVKNPQHRWWMLEAKKKEERRQEHYARGHCFDRLTERQKQILYYVRDFQFERRCSPTLREICDFFGFTVNAAKKHIDCIVKAKYLERSSDKGFATSRILFPRGTQFPWNDNTQLPSDIFINRIPQ